MRNAFVASGRNKSKLKSRRGIGWFLEFVELKVKRKILKKQLKWHWSR